MNKNVIAVNEKYREVSLFNVKFSTPDMGNY